MKTLIIRLDEYFLSDDPDEISIMDRAALYGFYLIIAAVFGFMGINLYVI